MSKLKLECHEANHICDKNQYKETSFWEKVKLTFHLMYCKACRQYTAKNSKLTKLVKSPKVESLDETAKGNLQKAFEAELAKQQQ